MVMHSIDIQGNQRADENVLRASSMPEEFIPIYYKEWFKSIDSALADSRNVRWRNSGQKCLEIKGSVDYWSQTKPKNIEKKRW